MAIEQLDTSSRAHARPRSRRSAESSTLTELLDVQRTAHWRDGVAQADVRIDRLDRLAALISDNAAELADAVMADYGSRPRDLSLIEIASCLLEINDQRSDLGSWMRISRVGRPFQLIGLDLRISNVPKGVVGIIGPWNFPIQLVISPAAAALAAGNRVMIRPSSVTARTTAVLAERAPEYFDLEELAIATASHGSGADFSKLPFDHLFFTGSPKEHQRFRPQHGERSRSLRRSRP